MSLLGSLYRRTLYRPLMRTLHRFDLHYAPEFGPIYPDGDAQLWCQWCGFRMNKPRIGRIIEEKESGQ